MNGRGWSDIVTALGGDCGRRRSREISRAERRTRHGTTGQQRQSGKNIGAVLGERRGRRGSKGGDGQDRARNKGVDKDTGKKWVHKKKEKTAEIRKFWQRKPQKAALLSVSYQFPPQPTGDCARCCHRAQLAGARRATARFPCAEQSCLLKGREEPGIGRPYFVQQ